MWIALLDTRCTIGRQGLAQDSEKIVAAIFFLTSWDYYTILNYISQYEIITLSNQ
jgi:hypothetical protein